jgi:hypothetical protein
MSGQLVPFDPRRHTPRRNRDGTISTELSMTFDSPDGGYWNVPSIWWSDKGPVELDENMAYEQALRYETETGRRFPRFNSVAEATRAAEERSQTRTKRRAQALFKEQK